MKDLSEITPSTAVIDAVEHNSLKRDGDLLDEITWDLSNNHGASPLQALCELSGSGPDAILARVSSSRTPSGPAGILGVAVDAFITNRTTPDYTPMACQTAAFITKATDRLSVGGWRTKPGTLGTVISYLKATNISETHDDAQLFHRTEVIEELESALKLRRIGLATKLAGAVSVGVALTRRFSV